MEIATTCEPWLNLAMMSEREFKLAVAYRLRQIRKAFEKNQEEIGKVMRVGKTAVSNYENGSRALDPYAALLLKQKYETPLEWLYLGVEGTLSADLAEKLSKAEAELSQEDFRVEPRRRASK